MNPLSGSNRLPVSPRRHQSYGLPLLSSSSSSAPTPPPHPPARHATFQRPFPVPPYLLHSSLFRDRYYTTPSEESAYSALVSPAADEGGSSAAGAGAGGGSGSGVGVRKKPSLSDALSVGPGVGIGVHAGDGLAAAAAATDAPILLPTCWDEDDRCALLELSSDGLGVSFAGSAKYGDRDAAAIRANRPVPSQCGVYYFEVTVVDKGVSGYIGIGLSHRTVSLSRLPGWEENSYGFHADDGRAFCCQGTGEPFGPTFTTGDVVGCGVDWTGAGGRRGERERSGPGARGREAGKGERVGGRVFFTKNGDFLGYAFCNLRGKLYPTVGLRTPNESVRVNFGADPFRFDIESLVLKLTRPPRTHEQERKRHTLSLLTSTPPSPLSLLPIPPLPPIPSLLPPSPSERVHETLQALVTSYLVHHGCAATAEAFARQVREEREERAYGLVPGGKAPSSATATAAASKGTGPGAASDSDSSSSSSIALSSSLRSRIRSAALSPPPLGGASLTLSLLEQHFPAVLAPEANDKEPDGGLLFRLRCRAFLEGAVGVARAGAGRNSAAAREHGEGEVEDDAAMSDPSAAPDPAPPSEATPTPLTLDDLLPLGRALSHTYGADTRPRVREELQAVLGVLAYADPEREAGGRTGELVRGVCGVGDGGRREREAWAEEVGRGVLLAASLPPTPALEQLYRHAAAAVHLAADLGAGGAAMVDVRGEVVGGL
ncbi:hypothetical protein JCM6882_007855 [Rhodosporidiobolus microsporus]